MTDELNLKKRVSAKLYLHFHPNVQFTLTSNKIKSEYFDIIFMNYETISMDSYKFADGFNKCFDAQVVIIEFVNKLETLIKINNNWKFLF